MVNLLLRMFWSCFSPPFYYKSSASCFSHEIYLKSLFIIIFLAVPGEPYLGMSPAPAPAPLPSPNTIFGMN